MSTVAGPAPVRQKRRRIELPPWAEKAFIPVFFVVLALLPFAMDEGGSLLDDMTLALAYIVMALGLNIIVGFAGLLDLGYVAFFAIGAYTMGWLGSGFFSSVNNEEGIHLWVGEFAASQPGIHLNFILVAIAAIVFTTIAGMIIGIIQQLSDNRIGGEWTPAIVFAYLILIMTFKPSGLLGEETREAG